MSKIILASDVGHVLSDDDLVFTSPDISSNKDYSISKAMIDQLYEYTQKIDFVLCSDAQYVSPILHCFQVKYKANNSLIKKTSALRERNFGVLEGHPKNTAPDLFNMTRILAEGGESIDQCLNRGYNCIKLFLNKHYRTVIFTHPLMCQYLSNFMLLKDLTYNDGFWQTKGAMAEFMYEKNNNGYKWSLLKKINERNH